MFLGECKQNISNVLLNNVSVDTEGTPIVWEGGEASFLVFGEFGGGGCKLQVSFDNINWVDYDSNYTNFTSNGYASTVSIAQGLYVRATLTGATTPSITAVLLGNHHR